VSIPQAGLFSGLLVRAGATSSNQTLRPYWAPTLINRGQDLRRAAHRQSTPRGCDPPLRVPARRCPTGDVMCFDDHEASYLQRPPWRLDCNWLPKGAFPRGRSGNVAASDNRAECRPLENRPRTALWFDICDRRRRRVIDTRSGEPFMRRSAFFWDNVPRGGSLRGQRDAYSPHRLIRLRAFSIGPHRIASGIGRSRSSTVPDRLKRLTCTPP
jgi:hypothetical protein